MRNHVIFVVDHVIFVVDHVIFVVGHVTRAVQDCGQSHDTCSTGLWSIT